MKWRLSVDACCMGQHRAVARLLRVKPFVTNTMVISIPGGFAVGIIAYVSIFVKSLEAFGPVPETPGLLFQMQ